MRIIKSKTPHLDTAEFKYNYIERNKITNPLLLWIYSSEMWIYLFLAAENGEI